MMGVMVGKPHIKWGADEAGFGSKCTNMICQLGKPKNLRQRTMAWWIVLASINARMIR